MSREEREEAELAEMKKVRTKDRASGLVSFVLLILFLSFSSLLPLCFISYLFFCNVDVNHATHTYCTQRFCTFSIKGLRLVGRDDSRRDEMYSGADLAVCLGGEG